MRASVFNLVGFRKFLLISTNGSFRPVMRSASSGIPAFNSVLAWLLLFQETRPGVQMDAETAQAAPALAAHLHNSPVRTSGHCGRGTRRTAGFCQLLSITFRMPSVIIWVMTADDPFAFPLIYCSGQLCAALVSFLGDYIRPDR
jgi:hypothetical protein